jgi:hypothetical protein
MVRRYPEEAVKEKGCPRAAFLFFGKVGSVNSNASLPEFQQRTLISGGADK